MTLQLRYVLVWFDCTVCLSNICGAWSRPVFDPAQVPCKRKQFLCNLILTQPFPKDIIVWANYAVQSKLLGSWSVYLHVTVMVGRMV